MLKRQFRLPAAEFPKRALTSLSGTGFTAKIRPNNLKNNRYAVVVGSNIERLATKRNATKRMFRDALSDIPNTGLDVMIIVRSNFSASDKSKIKTSLRDIFNKPNK